MLKIKSEDKKIIVVQNKIVNFAVSVMIFLQNERKTQKFSAAFCFL